MKRRFFVSVVLVLVAGVISGCTVFLGPELEGTLTAVAGEQRITQTPFLSLPVQEETPVSPAVDVATSTALAAPTLTSTPAPTPVPTETLTPLPLPVIEGTFDAIVFAVDSAASASLYPSGCGFPAGISAVYAQWRYRGMSEGNPYRAVWYRGQSVIEVTEGLWGETGGRKEGWARFLALERPEGLEQGQYRLELYIGDRLAQRAEFSVGEIVESSLPSDTPVATTFARLPPSLPGQTVPDAVWTAVRLKVLDGEGQVAAVGSGSIVDGRGWILTSLRVVADLAAGQLRNPSGEALVETIRDPELSPDFSHVAVVRNWDLGLELAILEITADAFGREIEGDLSLPSVGIGGSDAAILPLSAPLSVVGFADTGGGAVEIAPGEVTGRNTLEGGPWLTYVTQGSCASGGSMVLDSQGELVGVHSEASSSGATTLGFARPINEAMPLISATLEGGTDAGDLVVRCQECILNVIYTGSDGVNLRDRPSLEAGVLKRLHSGDAMCVIAPGHSGYWWAVFDGETRAGWVRERGLSGVKLARVETREFSSGVGIGDMAEVVCLNAEEMCSCANLRVVPGWRGKPEGDLVARLDAGAMVEIVSGPLEADGLVWWKVLEIATGLEGWVAEVTVGGYRTLFRVD